MIWPGRLTTFVCLSSINSVTLGWFKGRVDQKLLSGNCASFQSKNQIVNTSKHFNAVAAATIMADYVRKTKKVPLLLCCRNPDRLDWVTNRAARTEKFVMEVLMTTLLKGYFWALFSFSLTSTPSRSHRRVHFVSHYLPLSLRKPETWVQLQRRADQETAESDRNEREKKDNERKRDVKGRRKEKPLNQRGRCPAGFLV